MTKPDTQELPNTTLKLIDDSLADNDHETARESRTILVNWLARGGAEPDWTKYPKAARFCNFIGAPND